MVAKNQYVLPAIQREFVWKPEQISKLFNSLMQGYPFGTLLSWLVDSEYTDKRQKDCGDEVEYGISPDRTPANDGILYFRRTITVPTKSRRPMPKIDPIINEHGGRSYTINNGDSGAPSQLVED